jgi:hypothetical protein
MLEKELGKESHITRRFILEFLRQEFVEQAQEMRIEDEENRRAEEKRTADEVTAKRKAEDAATGIADADARRDERLRKENDRVRWVASLTEFEPKIPRAEKKKVQPVAAMTLDEYRQLINLGNC